MSRIWSVIIEELRLNFTRRSYLFMVFGIPLLAILAVVAYNIYTERQEPETEAMTNPLADLEDVRVGYVDESGLFTAVTPPYDTFIIPYSDETAVQTAVANGELDAYYHIPADYVETGEVVRYAVEFTIMDKDSNLFQAFLFNSLLAEEDPLVVARLQSTMQLHEHEINAAGETITQVEAGSWDQRFWLVYMYLILFMMATFISAGQLTQSVIREKENRMIEVALVSLRPLQLMSGKIIGQGIAGLLQFFIWVGTAVVIIKIAGVSIPFLANVELPASQIALFFLYFLGGYALFAVFAATIGAISKNMREGPQYAVVYSIPAVLPMMFLPQMVNSPNSALALAFTFFPLTAPLMMIQRLSLTAVPVWQTALSLTILFLSILGSLWFAGRLFHVNTLLSGELPTRRQLVQLIMRG